MPIIGFVVFLPLSYWGASKNVPSLFMLVFYSVSVLYGVVLGYQLHQ